MAKFGRDKLISPIPETGVDARSPPAFSGVPGSSPEGTTAIVHYYRGEIARMSSWRDRIDQTSNWAITVVAAMLSVSLSTPTAHHGVLLFAMLLIELLLLIEARRYRFYDVYRDRVRLIEKHYFARIFSDRLQADFAWAEALGASLDSPRFSITQSAAMTHRLRRNYGWMFLILLLGWLLKISSAMLQPDGAQVDWRTPFVNVIASAQLGPVSGWIVLPAVTAFYAFLLWLALQSAGDEDVAKGEVHV